MERRWVISQAYDVAVTQVRLAREEAGVTQRELARRLGKPPSFINKIELKERRLDVVELIAIARALQVRPEQILIKISDAMPDDLDI